MLTRKGFNRVVLLQPDFFKIEQKIFECVQLCLSWGKNWIRPRFQSAFCLLFCFLLFYSKARSIKSRSRFERHVHDPSADASCRGIPSPNGKACCSLACGTCGGQGCDNRPGGKENCCSGVIVTKGIRCDKADPPCIPGKFEMFVLNSVCQTKQKVLGYPAYHRELPEIWSHLFGGDDDHHMSFRSYLRNFWPTTTHAKWEVANRTLHHIPTLPSHTGIICRILCVCVSVCFSDVGGEWWWQRQVLDVGGTILKRYTRRKTALSDPMRWMWCTMNR